MSDFNIDLKKFAENAKKMKKVKEDFFKCFNAEAHELEKSIKTLFGENDQSYIFAEVVKLDIVAISFPKVGRLHTIFNYMEQNFLKKYFDNFLTVYTTKELPKPPTKPEAGSDKDVITEYNKQVKTWQEESKSIKEWNTKYNTMKEYLESIITVDLYGDTTLNITDLPYVYFKFFNTDIDEIEVFMQELKTCPAPPVKKIKTIRIEDISSKLPDFLKSANEVRVYFDTEEAAAELHGSKDYVEGVYEKYVIKNDVMKKDGGEWGLYNQRKDNLNNPVIGSFSLNTVPNPVNLNSGNSATPNEEFYNSDYEVDISDCYYGITTFNDEEVFAIVPKDFWEKYGTVLVNPTMKIFGITDNKVWKKEDMFFKSYDTFENAEEYLEELTEYSEEISNYLTEQSDLSPFRKALKKLLNATDFNDGWEFGSAEMYNLSSVKNFPSCKELYDKLDDNQKRGMWNQCGFNNETDFMNEMYLDEEQDFENCDVEDFDDETLTVRCGGDWQHPAFITFALVNGNIEVIDASYDTGCIDNVPSSYNSSLDEEDDNEEDYLESEDDEDDEVTIKISPNDCYWAIDYMDDDGDFCLSITPKTQWINSQILSEDNLEFDKFADNYEIFGGGEDGYIVSDKNSKPLKNLLLIAKVMKDSGFEFSKDIQKEFVGNSLNGKRVQYDTNSDDEYFVKASIEFSEYLCNLETKFGSSHVTNNVVNNASDVTYALGIDISNDIFLNMYIDSDFPDLEDVNKFILKGYKVDEVDEEGSGLFQLLYDNGEVVKKLSEIKLVIDKSGFTYSWELQQEIDNDMCYVNSNSYSEAKEYINALKVKLGQ